MVIEWLLMVIKPIVISLYLVGGAITILKNDGVRHWEGWHPIYEMENKQCSKYLVGGIPTPLKNMKVSWGDEISNIWKQDTCSKPPSSSILMVINGCISLWQLIIPYMMSFHWLITAIQRAITVKDLYTVVSKK